MVIVFSQVIPSVAEEIAELVHTSSHAPPAGSPAPVISDYLNPTITLDNPHVVPSRATVTCHQTSIQTRPTR